MTIQELKNAIFDLATQYWEGATVVWESNEKVKPAGSLVTLALGPVLGSTPHLESDETGDPYFSNPSQTTLTIQLFTHGKKVTTEGGGAYWENTAQDDLMDFVKFLTSVYVNEYIERYDIALLPDGGVNDATGIIDPNYEYRAYCEFTVYFTQTSRGRAGIGRGDWTPTPSGGGTQTLADKDIYTIEEAEITDSDSDKKIDIGG